MAEQNTLRGLLAMGKTKAQDSPMLRTLLDIPRVARENVGQPLTGLLGNMSMMDKAALATSPIPVVGDITGLVADAKTLYDDPSWKNAGLMGIGALPFVPSMGVVKAAAKIKPIFTTTKIPKALGEFSITDFPQATSVDSDLVRLPSGKGALLKDDMEIRVAKLADGNYLVLRDARWASGNKSFYGTGPDLEQLLTAAKNRSKKSDTMVAASLKSRDKLSGVKDAIGEQNLKFTDSQRSKSSYIEHLPSGLKIRISDHPLPIHYEQPDLDLPLGMDKQELNQRIIDFLTK